MWEQDIKIDELKEIRMRPNVYFGVGAISKINDIVESLKSKSIDKIIVVSGKNAYKTTGAWDYAEKALKQHNIGYVNYDKITPNPTTHQIDEAVKIAADFGAKAVIAIGGGSPIDAGKSVAILLKYPEKNCSELYGYEFTPEIAAPVVAINLTHGTGTETNRFAVVTIPEKNFKPAIAYDCIYPFASIDDPALMTKLSPEQTLYVSIDAVNHAVEAATTIASSPYSITLAKETIRLVAKYLPEVIKNPENLTARYFLAYASLLGGASFDNGLLHYTHALGHPLSAVKPELSHGLSLAVLLPAVLKYIYKEKSNTLADIFSSVVNETCGSPDEFAKKIEQWIFDLGIKSKLQDEGFTGEDIPKLVDLVYTTPSLELLLSLTPLQNTKEIVTAIYNESLTAYNS
ncbi:MAG: iron-containing alcohol dehydrogenase [Syntrophobacterales bacterium]|jgi:alcohol dehydrogenase|nr:iron-containing alcohol dehydrogenase [Syntrophobacterales bacterium]